MNVTEVIFLRSSDVPAATATSGVSSASRRVWVCATSDPIPAAPPGIELRQLEYDPGSSLNGPGCAAAMAQVYADLLASCDVVIKRDADTDLIDGGAALLAAHTGGLTGYIGRGDTSDCIHGCAYAIGPAGVAASTGVVGNGAEDLEFSAAAMQAGVQVNLAAALLQHYPDPIGARIRTGVQVVHWGAAAAQSKARYARLVPILDAQDARRRSAGLPVPCRYAVSIQYPIAPTPKAYSKYKLCSWLQSRNQLAPFIAALSAAPESRFLWDAAQDLSIGDPNLQGMLATIQGALGLTDAELDEAKAASAIF